MNLESIDLQNTDELELQCEVLREKLSAAYESGDEDQALCLLRSISKNHLSSTLWPLCNFWFSVDKQCIAGRQYSARDGLTWTIKGALTDGISAILEDPYIEFTALLTTLIRTLKIVVSRISRRREKFAIIGLRLILRLLDRLEEDITSLEFSNIDFCEIINSSQSIVSSVDLGKQLKEAFVLQLSTRFLSLLLWSSILDKPLKVPHNVLVIRLGSLWNEHHGIQSTISESQVLDSLARAWCEEGEGDDTIETKLAVDLERGCGLLYWAEIKFPSFIESTPVASRNNSLHKMITCLLKMPPNEASSPHILAGLDLVEILMNKSKVEEDWTQDWDEISQYIVHLMEKHPVAFLKMKAHSIFTSVVTESDMKTKWKLLSRFVFIQNDEVATLIVQFLKAEIVDVFDNENFTSVFSSTEICKLMNQLMTPPGGRTEWLKSDLVSRSNTLTAVFSICLFLVHRESKLSTNYTGLCSKQELEKLENLLLKLKEEGLKAIQKHDVEEAGITVEQELSLQRLVVSIDRLIEVLNQL
eukprot:g5449.t1